MVAEHPTTLRDCLRQTPRSLRWLTEEHADGWGVALCVAGNAWRVYRNAGRSGVDPRLNEVATSEPAEILVAHVRRRPVGRVCHANTPPFRRDRWIFAHSGTIEDREFVKARTSSRRVREVEGSTDSELLFSYLLSCLDVGAAPANAAEHADAALASAVLELFEHAPRGSFSFLLSDGRALYAHKLGSPLFFLQRRRGHRSSPPAPAAVMLAAKPMTEEAWQPLSEGALLRVDKHPILRLRLLVRGAEAFSEGSGPERPFTD
jgi:glutamine amidotransferase